MPDYLPINLNSLRPETTIGCDIHLLVSTEGADKYTLYCKGDTVFDNMKKELLLEKNMHKLYISKDDQQKYLRYLESNFHIILSDTRITSDEKSKIVYNTAANLLKDLFEDPRAGNVQRTKTFAYNMVDYVLQEGKAARNLLKIAIHEYYTYTHSVNVAAVGTLFAKDLGFEDEDLKHFCAGILLHDVGKTRISTDIINKESKLTEEEYEELKKHPELGVEILKETENGFTDEFIITLQHHENYDGTGYPYGLRGDEIHLCGRIARIIDVYDALTTNRAYSKAIRPFAALLEMKDEMLNCFDLELFKKFIGFAGLYDPRGKQRKGDRLHN